MSFFERLQAETAAERAALTAVPIIVGALRGEASVPSYVAFLAQAWHHVRHTAALLEACRDHLPARLAWLRRDLDEYIREEAGHDEWILADLAACGADTAAVRAGTPHPATRRMVDHAYELIRNGTPLGFLGMVHVLEGTSVALALNAAARIQAALRLPDRAFTYLRSHGELDRAHTAHFAELIDRLGDERDLIAVIDAANAFYRLYADVFRGLPLPRPAGAIARADR
jgi:pyrroloquinoline quinone (PQQ) biosynthesis protein C